jgi:Protein of unknown function (DUF1566)
MHLRTQRGAVLIVGLAVCLVAQDAHGGARRSRPLKTGQTACWDANGTSVPCAGTDQDGDLRRGESRSYQDNGDGTIRDKRTALTWEKMSNDGSVHDKDTVYTWAGAFSKIDSLNTAAFAGFTDWRLPNASELETLIDRGKVFPAIGSVFDTACPASCTVLTCSCTVAAEMIYWSSTSYLNDPDQAWLVNFFDGTAYNAPKGSSYHVRAVRGGS